jgi:hypothetical protein
MISQVTHLRSAMGSTEAGYVNTYTIDREDFASICVNPEVTRIENAEGY